MTSSHAPWSADIFERKNNFRSSAFGIGCLAQQNDGIAAEDLLYASGTSRRQNSRARSGRNSSHGCSIMAKEEVDKEGDSRYPISTGSVVAMRRHRAAPDHRESRNERSRTSKIAMA